MKKLLTAVAITISTLAANAQDANYQTDGFYIKNDFKNAKPTPFPELKPNDIGKVRRIFRDIDLTTENNKFFSSPQSRLIDVLIDGIMEEKIIAYDAASTKSNPTGDAFVSPLTVKAALAKFTDSVSVPIFDDNGNEIKRVMKQNDFNPDAITKFRLKEDWIFNKITGKTEPRIIGIAPLIRIEAAGETINEQPAFWINFNQARNVLAQIGVNSSYATQFSYDDIFLLRKFESTIIKEANPENLRLIDYVKDGNVKAESDRIEKSLTGVK